MMSPLKTCSFKCLLNMIRHSRTEQVDYVLCLVHFKNWTSQNSLQKLHFGSIKKEWNQTEQNRMFCYFQSVWQTLPWQQCTCWNIQSKNTQQLPSLCWLSESLKPTAGKIASAEKILTLKKSLI